MSRQVTANVVVPTDEAKLVAPLYVAVMVLDPVGALVDEHEAEPALSVPEHKTFEPSLNLTVPMGVPIEDVTVAE